MIEKTLGSDGEAFRGWMDGMGEAHFLSGGGRSRAWLKMGDNVWVRMSDTRSNVLSSVKNTR